MCLRLRPHYHSSPVVRRGGAQLSQCRSPSSPGDVDRGQPPPDPHFLLGDRGALLSVRVSSAAEPRGPADVGTQRLKASLGKGLGGGGVAGRGGGGVGGGGITLNKPEGRELLSLLSSALVSSSSLLSLPIDSVNWPAPSTVH